MKREKSSGYFAIGIEEPQLDENIGTLWRSAIAFGASFIFTIGNRYKKQYSDTAKAPENVPYHHYKDFEDFYAHIPYGCRLVGVELMDSAKELASYKHFERNIYLLGSESIGLSKEALTLCHDVIKIPSHICLNVATAGSVVLYDRVMKTGL